MIVVATMMTTIVVATMTMTIAVATMTDRRQPPARASKVLTTGASVSLAFGIVAAMSAAAQVADSETVGPAGDAVLAASVDTSPLTQPVFVATTVAPPAPVVATTPQVTPIPIAVNVPIPAAAPAPKKTTSNPPKKASSTKASG
jgi:hypothetical protein